MAYVSRIVMKPTTQIKKRLNLEENGEVQKYFTSTCAKKMDKYVPYKKGDLSDYIIHDKEIWYDQIYARYQYKGVREDGTHEINPANRTRIKHPLATSYWDKVMWTNHKHEIEKMVELKIKVGAKE